MYALVALVLVVIFAVAIYARTAAPPSDLGAVSGRLARCPESPNCVSSQAGRESQKVAPIAYTGDAYAAMERLHDIVAALPRAQIIVSETDYLYVEFTSRVFRFVDDVEFLTDPTESVIHVRSASRVGHSDFGANRRRVEQIRTKFAP